METTLIVICSAYGLALAVLVIEMIRAPVGYQDEGGFHAGEEPDRAAAGRDGKNAARPAPVLREIWP